MLQTNTINAQLRNLFETFAFDRFAKVQETIGVCFYVDGLSEALFTYNLPIYITPIGVSRWANGTCHKLLIGEISLPELELENAYQYMEDMGLSVVENEIVDPDPGVPPLQWESLQQLFSREVTRVFRQTFEDTYAVWEDFCEYAGIERVDTDLLTGKPLKYIMKGLN